MNGLFALNIAPFLVGKWKNLLPGLPEERRLRALNCRDDRTGAQLACAGWLLQRVLEEAGVPVKAQAFEKTPQGKPILRDIPQVHFSLSHGGDWVLCAVSDRPVGVDVELPRCTMEVARRFFCPEEVSVLEALAEDVQRDALCRMWTAKEAFVKALGGGLALGLDSFTVELTENHAILHQSVTDMPYRFYEYELGGHRVCLCSAGERPELRSVSAQ